jgi:hypothetical protein
VIIIFISFIVAILLFYYSFDATGTDSAVN